MNKHTPGPWEMRRDGYVYSVATGERVCSPHSTLPDSKKVSDQLKNLKQNARLIAAAPDLLEALKRMVLDGNCSDKNYRALALEQARTAIAKAEGA